MINPERLQKLMKHRNFSDRKLADEFGDGVVSDSTVRRWRKEGADLKLSLAVRLAEMFGVSLDYLIGKDDTPPVWEAADGPDWRRMLRDAVQAFGPEYVYRKFAGEADVKPARPKAATTGRRKPADDRKPRSTRHPAG